MKRITEVIREYDRSTKTGKKKIQIIVWFQKHPGKRFDITEVADNLQSELDIGQGRIGQYLNELEDDSVLKSYGEQRKAYQLSPDIIIPARFQVIAGLRHISAIFSVERLGISGVFVMSTAIWGGLTVPFWILAAILAISPSDRIGVLSEYELVGSVEILSS